MPFALVFVGLILIVTGSRNTYQQFGAKLVGDFTGPNNFLYWIAAIGAVGALGYVDSLKTFSRVFMSLILVSMILANGGVFAKLQAAIASGPVAPTPTPSALDNLGGTTNPPLTPSALASGNSPGTVNPFAAILQGKMPSLF
jgi:hypothetical protein